MSDLQLVAVGVMIILAGLAILVTAFRPAPPRLETVLAQLNAQPVRSSVGVPQDAPSAPPRWLPRPLVVFAERHLGATDEDLAILGRSRAQLALTKIGWAIGGALLPAVFLAILTAGGIRLPFTIPVVASLVLALLAWVNPPVRSPKTPRRPAPSSAPPSPRSCPSSGWNARPAGHPPKPSRKRPASPEPARSS